MAGPAQANGRGTGHDPRAAASTHNITGAGNTSPPEDPASGAERILDAAIDLFGQQGFESTSLKQIAVRAEVSAPLVIHHFGSKEGLRTACDARVADLYLAYKSDAVARSASPLPRNYVLEAVQTSRPLVRYLLQAFLTGGEHTDALFDRLVEDTLDYMADAERIGLVTPSANRRHRAVVLLLQGFGALMLHRQMKRLLGASPLEDPPEKLGAYMAAVLELHTQPLMDTDVYDELIAGLLPQESDDDVDPTPDDPTPRR
ncbi:TetR family transcriptional regulator [Nesterenkonia sp. HG001]|uniref:TetR family transcriptional regulator n=1 Tax=Nesterenkonia sp. HG001 TaxID=2983207 RepID=UPI002AC7C500|nr:TetR family transcriptional regulator [Nesterenkonia sp. HG001]MDZ5077386.1 TetR family transcriptional regulator [Nesterenkonia sp. HG001]